MSQAIRPAAEVVFWLSAAGVLYAYVAYPVVLFVLARLFGRASTSPRPDEADLPAVSLLIAAHNEESVIEARIRNALAVEYPRDKLEIVIASDGSDDHTNEVVRRYLSHGVRLLDCPSRRGKAAVLNAAMREVRGDIVLLSDANTFMDPHAARALVRWFAAPRVGVVCGRLILTDRAAGRNVDGVYWRYETFLKRNESRLGALLGSNGAIYAIRKDCFRPIPNCIIDDFVIPLTARLESGCRIVFDAQAVAREETAPDFRDEFRRRARIGTGGWQAIGLLWPLLDPRRGWVAFTFLSHKVLRWACPFLLMAALASNVALCDVELYARLLAAQLAFYAVAAAGWAMPTSVPFSRPARVATLFVTLNAALLVGFARWLYGSQGGTWACTPRSADGAVGPAAAAATIGAQEG